MSIQKIPKEIKVPTEIWSRPVGYYRPVSQWNPGKREEFRERKTYVIRDDPKHMEFVPEA